MKTTALAIVMAFVLGTLVAAGALLGPGTVTKTPRPVFSDAPWPFPIDQWGKGKAFRCKAADCGNETMLYLRAKIGFCNCTTGVADDEELARVSDLDLIGDAPRAVGDGRPIQVAWMKGRSRTYSAAGTTGSALAIAFNDRCDAIVATVVSGHDNAAAIESGVLAFLNGDKVKRWAEVTLGL
jgi:hypothetical protein